MSGVRKGRLGVPMSRLFKGSAVEPRREPGTRFDRTLDPKIWNPAAKEARGTCAAIEIDKERERRELSKPERRYAAPYRPAREADVDHGDGNGSIYERSAS
jgi:hypothetical protein